MPKVLNRSFFERPTLKVAPDLLGKVIVLQKNKSIKKGMIVEVEAYTGDDPASHSSRGITPRTKIMFGPAGHSYIYLIYGMYHCLNFVTEKEGTPGAVLIRALEIPREDSTIANGPGKLCRALKIDKLLNGIDCCSKKSSIYIAEGNNKERIKIIQTTRIGISKAKDYQWRWYIKNNQCVSQL